MASSHSGLIPLKTAYKKRGELLGAIMSEKNFINLHLAALIQFLDVIWFMPKNFAFFQNPFDKFFYKFDNPEINRQEIFPASLKNIENR